MLKEFLVSYRLPIIFGIIGLLIGLAILIIGFFKTMIVILLTLIGVCVGFYLRSKGFLDRIK